METPKHTGRPRTPKGEARIRQQKIKAAEREALREKQLRQPTPDEEEKYREQVRARAKASHLHKKQEC